MTDVNFSLAIFLYAYYFFLFVWGLFSLTALLHLLKYAFKGVAAFFAAFGYVAVSGLILLATYNYLAPVDWQEPIRGLEYFNIVIR